MVLGSTILAVALGLTPAPEGQAIQIDTASVTREVGRFAEVTDRNGVRHFRGFDKHGQAYEATVDTHGRVEAVVGDRVIEFTIADAN